MQNWKECLNISSQVIQLQFINHKLDHTFILLVQLPEISSTHYFSTSYDLSEKYEISQRKITELSYSSFFQDAYLFHKVNIGAFNVI